MAMALTVPRQKHHRQARDLADPQRPGWLAPGALDGFRSHFFEAREVVNA
jgi:hypothetical protein